MYISVWLILSRLFNDSVPFTLKRLHTNWHILSLFMFLSGGVWWIQSSILRPHRRLPPVLQHGQPHLISQHHQEVGCRYPGSQPFLADRSRRDSIRSFAGCERPHQLGPIQRQAHSELQSPQHGRKDQGDGLHRVFLAHAKELEGSVWCSHLCRH